MSPQENLDFFYPFLLDSRDPRFVTPRDRQTAFAKAASAEYIPACLSQELQNEAQAHYVAHILATRWAVAQSGKVPDPKESRVLVREKLGDAEVQYAAGAKLEILPVGMDVTPLAAWRRLMNRCGGKLTTVRK